MYSHFCFAYLLSDQALSDPIKSRQNKYHSLYLAGNILMMISAAAMCISTLVAYLIPEYFALGTQVSAHIATMLCATGLKVGYVMHLLGENGQIGHPHSAASGV